MNRTSSSDSTHGDNKLHFVVKLLPYGFDTVELLMATSKVTSKVTISKFNFGHFNQDFWKMELYQMSFEKCSILRYFSIFNSVEFDLVTLSQIV